jgi:hypothetical protein
LTKGNAMTSENGKENKQVGMPGGSLPKGSQSADLLVELVKRENLSIEQVVEQMDRDYQVTLARRVLSANANGVEVTFNVNAPDGWDAATIARLEKLSERIAKLWEDTRKSMMDFIKFGRVAYEKVWDYDKANVLSYIRKLEALPFRNTKMLLHSANSTEGPAGSFKGVELKAKGQEVTFGEKKSWWLAFEPTALEPHGRSMYCGAPLEVWKDRKTARDMRTKFLKRFALGGAVMRGPDRSVDEETGQAIDTQEAAARAYGLLQGGGLLYMPNDRIGLGEAGEGEYTWEFEDQAIAQKSESPISALMNDMDSEQLVAFGIPPKTVIEGDVVGSFAMVSQQMLILYSVVEDILEQEIDSFQNYVVDKQVERNFRIPDDTRLIEAGYSPLTERPDDLSVEMVKAWLQAPALSPYVLAGVVDVREVLERVGIPLSEQAEEKIEQMIAAEKAIAETMRQQAQQQPPTGQPPTGQTLSLANPPAPPAPPPFPNGTGK